MSDKTGIEWTDRTWNPLTGCTKVSPGCDHCYAKTMHERFHGPGSFDTITLHPDRLSQPLRWRKPSRVFVNSMSDLFHADVPDEYIARVFAVMALAPQHTFQLLTKRHARMRSLVSSARFCDLIRDAGRDHLDLNDDARYVLDIRTGIRHWPLPNVWLGVSVETQQWADIRIPALVQTPAAVRFLSCEPLLGPVDLFGDVEKPGPACTVEAYSYRTDYGTGVEHDTDVQPGVDWVIVGGESGPGARPMHPDWARSLRDQCVAAGVPFLFKQWGAWAPHPLGHSPARVGKRAAGRVLDGRTWDEYPAADRLAV